MVLDNRQFLMPVSIVVQAKKMGVSAVELQDMLRKSSRITHADGNRRFHEYLFLVEGHVLKSMRKMTPKEAEAEDQRLTNYVRREPVQPFYKCETCRDTGNMVVYDPCDACNGAGCQYCDDGLVRKEVNCPDCPKPQQAWNGGFADSRDNRGPKKYRGSWNRGQ